MATYRVGRRHRRHFHRHRRCSAPTARCTPMKIFLQRRGLCPRHRRRTCRAVRRDRCGAGAIEEIRHGNPVASQRNTRAEGCPRPALITTKGFRDVLEIRTLRMPRLLTTWPGPSRRHWSERYLRQVVDERIDHNGRIRARPRPRRCRRAVGALLAEKGRGHRRCLLNSFANPAHELMLRIS